MSDIAIKVNNVSKSFKIYHQKFDGFRDYFFNLFKEKVAPERFQALEGISFEIKKGEFFGVIGRNGSGKSTLLKIIAGIYMPDSGNIEINGSMTPFLELGVGFSPNLSARENVFLNGTILGLTRKQIEEKYDEIIDFADIREFQDMPLKTFSSGMTVRLAFSIAIQTDSDIYILDEVLAVGDSNFQAKSLAEFKRLKDRKKTVILVSHDTSSINQYCDRALYIKDHKIEAIGNTTEVVEKYVYEDRNTNVANDLGNSEENPYIQLEKIQLIDKKNSENEIFLPGDPIRIEATYKVKKRIKKPVFGFALHRDDNSHLFGDNTLINNGTKFDYLDPGIYKVSINIAKLPFLSGNILISLAVTDDKCQTTYFVENRKYSFNITPSRKQQGFVLIEPEWKVEKVKSKNVKN